MRPWFRCFTESFIARDAAVTSSCYLTHTTVQQFLPSTKYDSSKGSGVSHHGFRRRRGWAAHNSEHTVGVDGVLSTGLHETASRQYAACCTFLRTAGGLDGEQRGGGSLFVEEGTGKNGAGRGESFLRLGRKMNREGTGKISGHPWERGRCVGLLLGHGKKMAGVGWCPGQPSAMRRGARLPALNREQGKKGSRAMDKSSAAMELLPLRTYRKRRGARAEEADHGVEKGAEHMGSGRHGRRGRLHARHGRKLAWAPAMGELLRGVQNRGGGARSHGRRRAGEGAGLGAGLRKRVELPAAAVEGAGGAGCSARDGEETSRGLRGEQQLGEMEVRVGGLLASSQQGGELGQGMALTPWLELQLPWEKPERWTA
jgi:hypothetical protein